jgi:hypothetical protein
VDDTTRDPGWPSIGAVAGSLWTVVMPGARVRLYQHHLARGRNGVTLLRVVFVQCLVMTAVVAAAVLLIDPDRAAGDVATAVWAVVVVGVGAAAVVVPRRVARTLTCTSDVALATSYSNRFFLRVTAAQAPTIAGFVAALFAGSVLLGFLGVGFSIAGFVLAAPTRRQLTADQRALDTGGCHRSLVEAVVGGGRPPATG